MPEQPRTFDASIEQGHALAGINTRGILKFLFLLFIPAAIVIHVAVYFLLGYSVRRQQRTEAPAFPLGLERPTTLPQPLQPSIAHPALPWQDLPLLRDADLQALHTAGPLPNDPAHRHIPIDQAMQLLLQRGNLNEPATAPATQPWKIRDSDRPATVENRT